DGGLVLSGPPRQRLFGPVGNAAGLPASQAPAWRACAAGRARADRGRAPGPAQARGAQHDRGQEGRVMGSVHDEAVEHAVSAAIDDARLRLTSGYAANDPEIREIARVAVKAVREWDIRHRENLPDEVLDALTANSDAITAGIWATIELRQ